MSVPNFSWSTLFCLINNISPYFKVKIAVTKSLGKEETNTKKILWSIESLIKFPNHGNKRIYSLYMVPSTNYIGTEACPRQGPTLPSQGG
jgi:hypothetical protein